MTMAALGALATKAAPVIAKTIGGAAINVAKSRIQRNRDLADQRAMLAYQNHLNRQNWSMQNIYNDPKHQMARLKSAGLNPNLVYAQGGALTGAGEIASPSAPSMSPYWTGDDFDFGRYVNESEGLQADISLKQSQRDVNEAQQAMLKTEKAIADIDLNWAERMKHQEFVNMQMKQLVDQMTANHLESVTGINRRDIDTYYLRLDNTLANDRVQRMIGKAGIDKIQKEIQQINSLISKTNDETRLLQLQYARDAIAKQIEEFVLEFQKSGDWKEKNESGKHNNMQHQLYNEMQMLEKEILGKTISNIDNPIRDIVFPLAAAWLLRTKKMPPIGFK